MSHDLLTWLPFGLVALGVLVLAAVLLWRARWEGQRREALEEYARGMGFNFQVGDGPLPAAELAALHLFKQGRRQRSSNVMRRAEGQGEVVCFDYRFTVGGGQQSNTRRQTVVAFRQERRQLPAFELRPESFVHKIGAVFGYQDIDFDDAPEFSRSYLLRGADENAVRKLFGPAAQRAFEQMSGWSVEGQGTWIVAYRAGKRVRADDLATFLADAARIRQALVE